MTPSDSALVFQCDNGQNVSCQQFSVCNSRFPVFYPVRKLSTSVLWRGGRWLTCLFNAASKAQVHDVTSTISHYKKQCLSTRNILTTMSVSGPLPHCKTRTASRGFIRPPPLLMLTSFSEFLCFSVYCILIAFLSECSYLPSEYFLILCLLMSVCLSVLLLLSECFCCCLYVFVICWIFVLLCVFCCSLCVFVIRWMCWFFFF
jgi:hypothetical protein